MSEVKLPEGWVKTSYGDLLFSASNGVGGVQNKSGLGIPVSRIETIANEEVDFSRIGFLEHYDVEKIAKHKLNSGDILFSHINSPVHLGKTALFTDSDRELYHGINLLRIVVNRELILPEIFNYHCKYSRAIGVFSLNAQHAVNQSSLNQKKLFSFVCNLPSIAEQKVIVDKLDTLLAQVDSIKARLEQIPQILKRFRQVVLASAVSGKLTEEWRGTTILTDWKKGILKNFIKKPSYGTSAKSQKEGLIPVLRMGNLQSGKLDWSDLVYTSDKNEIEKYNLIAGDILFNRTNSPELVGKTSIYRGEREAIYAGYLIKIQCLEALNAEYLNYHLNSPIAKQYCYEVKADGVSQSNINAQKLVAYPLEVPPINEQHEIVRRVEQFFTYADGIENQVQNALERVNSLTQSILTKAFRGELTAQWRAENPDLISGENSAQALLVKFQQQRKSTKTIKQNKSNS